MSRHIITLVVGFALGAILVLDVYQRHPVACAPEPAPTVRPVREPMMLSSPLACERGYTINCADFALRSECKEACL